MTSAIAKIFLTSEFDSQEENIDNTNTDVVVLMTSGEQYIASFCTFQNLESFCKANSKSGAFLKGKYFWARNLLLIDHCSKANIKKVIQHLLDEGDFRSVFNKIS